MEKKIKMLEDKNASPDGSRIIHFEKGGVYPVDGYNLTENLSNIMIDEKWATLEEETTDNKINVLKK
jgi:hypothetical protein